MRHKRGGLGLLRGVPCRLKPLHFMQSSPPHKSRGLHPCTPCPPSGLTCACSASRSARHHGVLCALECGCPAARPSQRMFGHITGRAPPLSGSILMPSRCSLHCTISPAIPTHTSAQLPSSSVPASRTRSGGRKPRSWRCSLRPCWGRTATRRGGGGAAAATAAATREGRCPARSSLPCTCCGALSTFCLLSSD